MLRGRLYMQSNDISFSSLALQGGEEARKLKYLKVKNCMLVSE